MSDSRQAATRLRSGAAMRPKFLWAAGSLSVALAGLPASLGAQTWRTQAAVQANLTATSNGALAASGEERKDLILSVRPTLQVSADGANLKLKALLGADLVSYARGTQPDRITPAVRADLNATLVERLFFVDASIDSHQAELDPFAPRSEAGTTQNRRVATTYRLSPYVNYEISPRSTLLARYDEVQSRTGGDADALANQRLSAYQLRAQTKPLPLGGSIELLRQDTRITGAGDADFTLESLKVAGDIAFGGEFTVGPIVGRERTTLLFEDHSDTLYGAHLLWVPGERTRLEAEVDHRFFGTGWDLSLRHRTPFASMSLRWSRAPVTAATSLGVSAAGSDLTSFLDAILTTRYPDAAARAALVSSLISSRGLPNSLAGGIDVLAGYAQLRSRADAALVLLGTRNTVSISAYRQTLTQLQRSDDSIGSLLPLAADNRQTGATVDLNRRLTPQLSADLRASWSRISGLADRLGDVSEEQTYRLSMIQALSLHTGVSAGLQYNKFKTTVVGIDSYAATAAFIGLSHRF
jgi:uncharacterized protein (PEP-CTERM system associated)